MSLVGVPGLGMGPGAAPGGGLRFSSTRGRIQGSVSNGMAYPNPFFDIAHTYLPVTVKHMFRWLRYFFMTQPIVNATVFKLSEYPITDIIIGHDNPRVVEQLTEYFQDHLQYRAFQVEVGLDYHTYGNAFISIGYPFVKYVTCPNCKFSSPARKVRSNYVFTNNEFRLTCPKCAHTGTATVKDYYFRNPSGIKLIRWNPEDIEITYNDITGEYTYFYTIPANVRSDIMLGRKDILESTPQVFIEAIKQSKGIVFSKDNFFHMRRPTLATVDRGWGLPLLLPVLKDVFYLQIMKKAQEAILLEHIVPLRIIFPQAGSGTSDPYTTINLNEWREHVSGEIARWRYDPNYIPIMPLPLGNQTIGGDGRGLLMSSEISMWTDWIIMGMGVPREFLQGGLSYSGSNVSMRMLENGFIGYILRHRALARWVMQSVTSFMQWPIASIRFKPFKMADDLQRKAYRFQLNAAQKISDTTLLADDDLDQEEENSIMERETATRLRATKAQQLAMAEIQGEQQLIMMKYQAKAQEAMTQAQGAPQAPGEPGGPSALDEGTPGGQFAGAPAGNEADFAQMGQSSGPPAGAQSPLGQSQRIDQGSQPMDITTIAQHYAQQIAMMPPDQMSMAIQTISAQSPELAELVVQMLAQMGIQVQPQQGQAGVPGAAGEAATDIGAEPLPEELPPRREAGLV